MVGERWCPKEVLLKELFRDDPGRGTYEHGNVLVYALVDPRDRTVRYVGVTGDRESRLRNHVKNPAGPRMRNWIAKLAREGLEPQMLTIGYALARGWQQAEVAWIAWFGRQGWSLYNRHPGGAYERGGVRQGAPRWERLSPETYREARAERRRRKRQDEQRKVEKARERASDERSRSRARLGRWMVEEKRAALAFSASRPKHRFEVE